VKYFCELPQVLWALGVGIQAKWAVVPEAISHTFGVRLNQHPNQYAPRMLKVGMIKNEEYKQVVTPL
jgi:hypothetical protein